MTAASNRQKGVLGEREVAKVWKAAGFEVRGLEGQGDHLVIGSPQRAWRDDTYLPPIHVECKRQERIQLPIWLRQAEAEAPQGTIPVVCFRQNKGEWYAALRLADLVGLAS